MLQSKPVFQLKLSSASRGLSHRRGQMLRSFVALVGPVVLLQPGITGRYLQEECGAAASVCAGIPHPLKCAAAAVQLLSHPQTHPVGVRTCYHTPFLSHPQTHLVVGVRTSYQTPWFITPPLDTLRAELYHPGHTRYHTPHRIPHPVILFSNPKMLPPGCVFLCQLR